MQSRSTRPTSEIRNGAETRAKILEVAQTAFAESGYSQTGMRDIAARAGVTASLLTKYFQTKARLFEEALTRAVRLTGILDDTADYPKEALIDVVTNPKIKGTAPAMIALSLGDAEARKIAARVARDHIIARLTEFLGPPQARSRAMAVLM